MKSQSIDTSLASERALIEILRSKNVAGKFSLIRSLSKVAIQLSRRAISRANQEFDDDQVKLRFIALHYGPELANRVRECQEKKNDDSRHARRQENGR